MPTHQEYQHLIAEIDQEIDRLTALYGEVIHCRKGCAGCCQGLSVFPLEAAVIKDAVQDLDAERRRHILRRSGKEGNNCPFLLDSCCAIYIHRPLICRTHGLPIAYVDDERQAIEVSGCPVNFPENTVFDPEALLFLDRFNSKLATLNEVFARKLHINPCQRLAMGEILRFRC